MASSTKRKSVLGSPWLSIGGKVQVRLLNGDHYGVLESADKKFGTVLLQNGQRQTVTGKQLRSVGQHTTNFTRFLNNPVHDDTLEDAKREAEFIGPGTCIFEDKSAEAHGLICYDVVPPGRAGRGVLIHTVS